MVDVEAKEALDNVELTVGIVSAYVSRNSISPSGLPAVIASVYTALVGLSQSGSGPVETEDAVEKATPSQIKKSITPDALISFIDGKPYKALRRHISTRGLDFETYRARYGLPADYPTVAANYSAARSAIAKDLGLGQQRKKPKA